MGIGITTIVEQASRESYEKGRGYVLEREWIGLPSSIDAFIPPGEPLSYNRRAQPPMKILTATYSLNPDDFELEWQLDWNDLEKSLWDLPKGKALTQESRAQIKKAIRETEELGSAMAGILYIRDQADTQEAKDFFYEWIKGVEAWIVSQPVLRKNMSFDPAANISIGFNNINKVYTAAAMLSEEPSLHFTPFVFPADGFWIKKAPRVSAGIKERWSLTQEWWNADDYSTYIYGTPIT